MHYTTSHQLEQSPFFFFFIIFLALKNNLHSYNNPNVVYMKEKKKTQPYPITKLYII